MTVLAQSRPERLAGDPAWTPACPLADLLPERGVCALVDGTQVAVFLGYDNTLYAVSNYDPFSGAFVLSRGIMGTRGDVPTVASPVGKQVFGGPHLGNRPAISADGTRSPPRAAPGHHARSGTPSQRPRIRRSPRRPHRGCSVPQG